MERAKDLRYAGGALRARRNACINLLSRRTHAVCRSSGGPLQHSARLLVGLGQLSRVQMQVILHRRVVVLPCSVQDSRVAR
jgi:hypothetical protein